MKKFKTHQISQIVRYIKCYYKGSFYVENEGPFIFDFGQVKQSNVYGHDLKKFISNINRNLKAKSVTEIYD